MEQFNINIGTAVFNNGFINIPVAFGFLFGEHNAHLNIFLANRNNSPIDSWVNRNANPNESPRIMIGNVFTNWIQENHQIGEQLIVTIDEQHPNGILIQ